MNEVIQTASCKKVACFSVLWQEHKTSMAITVVAINPLLIPKGINDVTQGIRLDIMLFTNGLTLPDGTSYFCNTTIF